MKEYDNKRELIRLEYETGLYNLKSLSLKYNVPYDTICTWKKKYNWTHQKVIRAKDEDLINKAKVMFETSSLNLKQISSKLNVNRNTLQTWKEKYNWIKDPVYMTNYKKSLNSNKLNTEDNSKLKELYENTSLSIPQISLIINLTVDQVRYRIKHLNLKRSEILQRECNSQLGKERQFNLSSSQKQIRNMKIKQWNINNIGKIHLTRKQRNRYSKSQIEDTLYEYLVKEFGEANVERQYIIDNYSFDFRIYRYDAKTNDYFYQLIEIHGGFYHNFRPYINCKEHNKELQSLIDKGGMYKTIAHKWSCIDPNKFNYCKKNNLNLTVIYINEKPRPYFTNEQLNKSLQIIKNFKPGYTNLSRNNELIDNFCYKEIYTKSILNLKNSNKLYPYLINRIKYAYDNGRGCHIIDSLKLLKDFNKQGNIYNTFTSHPITNIMTFIQEYNIKNIADPFAGWGHRMLGATLCNCNYIGCDINYRQYINLLEIQNYLALNNLSKNLLFNEDSRYINTINLEYEAIFTCPPYYNKEIYTSKGIENLSYPEFKNSFKQVFDNWITDKVKYVGIQFTDEYEDCIDNLGYNYIKIPITKGVHHFNKDTKKFHEFIYMISL